MEQEELTQEEFQVLLNGIKEGVLITIALDKIPFENEE